MLQHQQSTEKSWHQLASGAIVPSFPSVLNAASLAFLQHGDLREMANSLLTVLDKLPGTEGGLIFDLAGSNEPRLLASSGEHWHQGIHPDPTIAGNWTGGYPQTCWTLPLTRGEELYIEDQENVPLFPLTVKSVLALPLASGNSSIGALFIFGGLQGLTPDIRRQIAATANTIALGLAAARDRHLLQQTELELRQAQKMEALGQLAAGVAHDFNNMLTVINGYTSLVRKQIPEGKSAHEDLGTVLEAGQKAADLSRQLLAFSRRQVLQPQVIDLNSRLDGLQKMLRRLIRENIVFEINLTSDLPYIKADPGQLEQVLMNLVINARDAMPDGGQLTISSGWRDFDRSFMLQNPGAKPGRYAWFSIHDTGEGISPGDQKKVFQPFFTTKAQGKGTGLGLATVYGIVKQSGGYISLESQPGQGACFTVYLPQTEDGPQQANQPHPRSKIRNHGKLLLVEDDREVLNFATKALVGAGFEVIPAGDVELAQDLFDCHRDDIVLLITDMVMPTLSGPLLARNLRRIEPGLPVLFLSGYGQVTFSNDFFAGEQGHFIPKPFTTRELVTGVQDAFSSAQTRPGTNREHHVTAKEGL